MTALGAPALWFAWIMLVAAGAGLAAVGRRPSPLRAAATTAYLAATLAVGVAVTALGAALVRHEFSVRYVAQFTSVMLDAPPALAALWAGAAGSQLWGAALLVVSGAISTLGHRRRALTPLATATMAGVSALALVALLAAGSPFVRLASPPPEGRGLDPQLLHAGLFVQPPLLWAGLALTAVPFAFTVARWFGPADDRALDAEWRGLVQRWVVVAWGVLSVAFAAGVWWAQQQLGWFGYFFTWEPYASAPLLAWVALSALLFVLVSGVDRRSDPRWLAALVAFAFLLAAAGAVRARGGVAASIRAVDAIPATVATGLVAAGLGLVALAGWAAWRLGTTTHATARAGIGGLLALVGVLVTSLALVAQPWRQSLTMPLDIGQVTAVRDPFGAAWQFTSQGLSSYQEPAYTVVGVALTATRRGARVGLLTSQQRQYFDALGNELFEPLTRVGARALPHETVTLAFLGALDRTRAAMRIGFVPLVHVLWLGLGLTMLGALLAGWPTEPLPRPLRWGLPARSDRLHTPAPDAEPCCPACGATLTPPAAHFCAQCGAAVRTGDGA